MITKELACESISGLVTRFDEQYDSYKRSDYNETQKRRDFIDPFFKSMGFAITHSEIIQYQFIRAVLTARLSQIEERIGIARRRSMRWCMTCMGDRGREENY